MPHRLKNLSVSAVILIGVVTGSLINALAWSGYHYLKTQIISSIEAVPPIKDMRIGQSYIDGNTLYLNMQIKKQVECGQPISISPTFIGVPPYTKDSFPIQNFQFIDTNGLSRQPRRVDVSSDSWVEAGWWKISPNYMSARLYVTTRHYCPVSAGGSELIERTYGPMTIDPIEGLPPFLVDNTQ